MGCTTSKDRVNTGEVDMSHFELLRIIGKGASGTVSIARPRRRLTHNNAAACALRVH
jgi:hypothetical protein